VLYVFRKGYKAVLVIEKGNTKRMILPRLIESKKWLWMPYLRFLVS
jgi:hypothetical protein